MLQFQSAQFLGRKRHNLGMDGVAKHIEILDFQIDGIQGNVGIVHQMVFRLFRLVFVLVPKHEIKVLHGNPVHYNTNRGAFRFLNGVVAVGKGFGQKSEVELVFAFIHHEISLRIAQLHRFQMDATVQQVADVESCTQ